MTLDGQLPMLEISSSLTITLQIFIVIYVVLLIRLMYNLQSTACLIMHSIVASTYSSGFIRQLGALLCNLIQCLVGVAAFIMALIRLVTPWAVDCYWNIIVCYTCMFVGTTMILCVFSFRAYYAYACHSHIRMIGAAIIIIDIIISFITMVVVNMSINDTPIHPMRKLLRTSDMTTLRTVHSIPLSQLSCTTQTPMKWVIAYFFTDSIAIILLFGMFLLSAYRQWRINQHHGRTAAAELFNQILARSLNFVVASSVATLQFKPPPSAVEIRHGLNISKARKDEQSNRCEHKHSDDNDNDTIFNSSTVLIHQHNSNTTISTHSQVASCVDKHD
ncbi:hypothetical protein BDF22DRAFT_697500 [Syncephalis plumigaleata]|nr:hypothetical protein BDF22DRAFT_697500 [Syncephalis plumigaleata]